MPLDIVLLIFIAGIGNFISRRPCDFDIKAAGRRPISSLNCNTVIYGSRQGKDGPIISILRDRNRAGISARCDFYTFTQPYNACRYCVRIRFCGEFICLPWFKFRFAATDKYRFRQIREHDLVVFILQGNFLWVNSHCHSLVEGSVAVPVEPPLVDQILAAF